MPARPRIGLAAIAAAALLGLSPGAATAASDPANQPPFGGEDVPPLVKQEGQRAPAGFELSADRVLELAGPGAGTPTVATRGEDLWEVRFRNEDAEVVRLVVVDDRSGEVIDVFTGEKIETELARGYEGAVAGKANSWWIWLPLCLLFLAPFVDPRRPLRLLHLDLLVLLGLSVSLYFFNRGEIEASVLLVYPVLGYVFARMLGLGFGRGPGRDRDGPLLPLAKRSWLVAGIVVLAVFHVGYQAAEGKVIDVGIAGVIGADRLTDGEDVYGEDFGSELPESGDVRGDVYGPVNYEAYVPFELALPYEGEWDEVPAARAAAVAFTLLTAIALFLLGRALSGRAGATARTGPRSAWRWPSPGSPIPSRCTRPASSFNDSLVALLVVCSLLAVASPPARGALAALAGLTKFGPLALAPMLAAGDRRPAPEAARVVRRRLRRGRRGGDAAAAARRRPRRDLRPLAGLPGLARLAVQRLGPGPLARRAADRVQGVRRGPGGGVLLRPPHPHPGPARGARRGAS